MYTYTLCTHTHLYVHLYMYSYTHLYSCMYMHTCIKNNDNATNITWSFFFYYNTAATKAHTVASAQKRCCREPRRFLCRTLRQTKFQKKKIKKSLRARECTPLLAPLQDTVMNANTPSCWHTPCCNANTPSCWQTPCCVSRVHEGYARVRRNTRFEAQSHNDFTRLGCMV